MLADELFEMPVIRANPVQLLAQPRVVREQSADATLHVRLLTFECSQMESATASEDEYSDEGTEDQEHAEAWQ